MRRSASTIRARAIPLMAVWLSLVTSPVRAEAPAVPLQLQVELTAKLIEYAQSPSPQGQSVIRIGIVVRGSSVESQHFGTELKSAFSRIGNIAGLPHEEFVVSWSTPAALLDEVKRRQLFAVYLTPGLGQDVGGMARALEGTPVLTVGAIDSYVPAGAILGFELVSARPKMVLNLAQAKKQGVAFRASVMKLMRILG